jgi:hypothetical protein
MVNSANFGVSLQATANIANADIGVAWIRVTVYYTPPAAQTYYGVVALPLSVTFVTAGVRTTKSAIALPLVASVDTASQAVTPGRISLSAGETPSTRTAHSIKVRARVTGGSGVLYVALYEGSTNRSGDLTSDALTGTLAEYTIAIADADAANITDYSNLELRFWGVAASGDTSTFEVDQIWLEIPLASVGAQTYYGTSASAYSLAIATVGTRKTFSAVIQAFTFTAVTQGRRFTKSSIVRLRK